LTLETLSKNTCYTDGFDTQEGILHIDLAKWADFMIIAPATADALAKMANGIADQLLFSTVLALDKPCYIFPSMNSNMYTHPSVQENISKLTSWGYVVHEPAVGDLACGDEGKGRLPDVNIIREVIIGEMEHSNTKSTLAGKKIIVTAGSTRSYIDPVRYIVNNSSGRMGVELVREAWLRGAEVTLVSNEEVLQRFSWVKYYSDQIYNVETTEDVMKAVSSIFSGCDIYISAAALCDFKNNPQPKKIKKEAKGNVLTLEPAVDVFSELSKKKKSQIMIGFALESEELEYKAMAKLNEKGMDMVIANSVEAIGAVSSDVYIMDKKGIRKFIKKTDKREIAKEILDEIEIFVGLR
jgi:phosphopantothenoylcysteine decarboxylase / phosphopantothenate---cysteine ligase